MRERIYHSRNNETKLYEEADKNYYNCKNEAEDNLVKMAKTICKPSDEEFNTFFS